MGLLRSYNGSPLTLYISLEYTTMMERGTTLAVYSRNLATENKKIYMWNSHYWKTLKQIIQQFYMWQAKITAMIDA